MTEERKEWIKKYLKGKMVKIMDLKDFFVLENDGKGCKNRKIEDGLYSYEVKGNKFSVLVELVADTLTTYTIKEVYCEEI